MNPDSIAFVGDPFAAGDAPIRVRWLGTAGFAITHGDHTVLIDPYLTRASLARCALGTIASDEATVRRYAPRADAIVVGHTHFDHALDVPLLAKLTGAKVFGSRSAVTLCRASGVPETQVDCVEREAGGAAVEREVGPFRLRFVPSAHARILLGRVPAPGEIADCDDVPQRIGGYRCGAVFGVEIAVRGKTLFHLGSAELVDASLEAKNVDLVLLCVAGWTASRDPPRARRPPFVAGRRAPVALGRFFPPARSPRARAAGDAASAAGRAAHGGRARREGRHAAAARRDHPLVGMHTASDGFPVWKSCRCTPKICFSSPIVMPKIRNLPP